MANKFYITTAIAYASRKPHAGNDYEIIFTDAIARYHRLIGDDVFMLTGTDEHGQKIQELAEQEQIKPQQYADRITGAIKENYQTLQISNDHFIRTTDDYHEKVVQKVFKKLFDQGDIYKSEYEGWYCTPCESFWTETQVENGCCPDCGRPVKKTKEEAYFFRMSKYQDRLLEYIESHPNFIQPESRKKEMINNFLKPGLQDLCVSRTTFDWGVKVDFDPKHVIYVWIDALLNYITALGYDPDGSSENFKKYWPCDIHVIGKDILRFHTIYWPIMLMALGVELPKQVFGHPWLLFGSDKMSKSKGNVMYSSDLAKLFSVDGLRYYVLSEMPYAQDGSITYETLISRYNSDLANTLGNLVNRTISMTNQYFGGQIHRPTEITEVDQKLQDTCLDTVKRYCGLMNDLRLSDAADAVISLARAGNKYIDDTTPWALAKDETKRERLNTVLYHLLETIRYIAVISSPLMPETSEKIFAQLGSDVKSFDSLSAFGGLQDGTVTAPTPLFARIDEKKMLEQLQKEAEQQKAAAAKAEEKTAGVALIGIEDFAKVSLRVAKITACEKVEKSDKLLKLQLDDGEGGRQVVSGIATWYAPEDLIGKKIVLVANLKPVKLRGVDSNGMILAADCGKNKVQVLFVDDLVPIGSQIR